MTPFEVAELGLPIMMLVAVAASVAIGLLLRPVSVRVYREKVRRMSRSVRTLTDQLDTAEADLAEERALVNRLVTDLVETRRALRAATADPSQASPHHMATTHIRQIAARPLPGESTGAHAAFNEETRD